jgi:hypothetical protein
VALFDSPLTLRQPQKPVLADALWTKLSSNGTSGSAGDIQCVLLDDRALLHESRGLEEECPHSKSAHKFYSISFCIDVSTFELS